MNPWKYQGWISVIYKTGGEVVAPHRGPPWHFFSLPTGQPCRQFTLRGPSPWFACFVLTLSRSYGYHLQGKWSLRCLGCLDDGCICCLGCERRIPSPQGGQRHRFVQDKRFVVSPLRYLYGSTRIGRIDGRLNGCATRAVAATWTAIPVYKDASSFTELKVRVTLGLS
jgi:hypothetical protein